jgi:uncharacterized protein YdeI (YjbR/CyaY-like superfamily)
MTVAGSALPQIEVTSRAQLRAWLAANHDTSGSIWLVTWKKQTPDRHVPYDEIVEEALCFGWVDSLPRKLDAGRTMLLLSPRKRGSAWSAANKTRVERLIADGRMEPAGLAAIEIAKAEGSWSFLDDVERLEVPADLAEALADHPEATKHFAVVNTGGGSTALAVVLILVVGVFFGVIDFGGGASDVNVKVDAPAVETPSCISPVAANGLSVSYVIAETVLAAAIMASWLPPREERLSKYHHRLIFGNPTSRGWACPTDGD